MPIRVCSNCRAFDRNSSTCRAEPPKVYIIENGRSARLTPARWPTVAPTDWCVSFSEKREDV